MVGRGADRPAGCRERWHDRCIARPQTVLRWVNRVSQHCPRMGRVDRRRQSNSLPRGGADRRWRDEMVKTATPRRATAKQKAGAAAARPAPAAGGDAANAAAAGLGTGRRVRHRCDAAHDPVLGRDAPAQRPVLRAEGEGGAARAQLRRRTGAGRPHLRQAGQLPAGADPAAARDDDRSAEAAVRGGRSARRARAGHRRLQGRQRARRGDARRPSLLLRRLHARADAGPDHRGHHARRGGVPREGDRPAPRAPKASPASSATARPAGRCCWWRRSGPSCSARSSSPARRCPTGPASRARTRCATPAAWPAAAG